VSKSGHPHRIGAAAGRGLPVAIGASTVTLAPEITPLLAALGASVLVMTYAASKSAMVLSAMACGMFAGAIIAMAAVVNSRLWSDARPRPFANALSEALARNAGLSAVAYAWGSATLLAIYTLSGLKWQHGWQYGAAMALVAGLHVLFLTRLSDPASWLRTPSGQDFARGLSALHGLAALGALAYLLHSGKLARVRPDWAANQVFVAGLIAVVAICAFAAYTHGRLASRR